MYLCSFPEATGSVPIMLNGAQCSGTESGIHFCRSGVIQGCAHSDDVGLICSTPATVMPPPPPPNPSGNVTTTTDSPGTVTPRVESSEGEFLFSRTQLSEQVSHIWIVSIESL